MRWRCLGQRHVWFATSEKERRVKVMPMPPSTSVLPWSVQSYSSGEHILFLRVCFPHPYMSWEKPNEYSTFCQSISLYPTLNFSEYIQWLGVPITFYLSVIFKLFWWPCLFKKKNYDWFYAIRTKKVAKNQLMFAGGTSLHYMLLVSNQSFTIYYSTPLNWASAVRRTKILGEAISM